MTDRLVDMVRRAMDAAGPNRDDQYRAGKAVLDEHHWAATDEDRFEAVRHFAKRMGFMYPGDETE